MFEWEEANMGEYLKTLEHKEEQAHDSFKEACGVERAIVSFVAEFSNSVDTQKDIDSFTMAVDFV